MSEKADVTIRICKDTHEKLKQLMNKHKYLRSMDGVIRFLIEIYEKCGEGDIIAISR